MCHLFDTFFVFGNFSLTMGNNEFAEKTIESYRNEFPVTKGLVYLDHAAVAPVSLRVKKAVIDFLIEASESAIFSYESWMDRIDIIRDSCAGLVGSDKEEIGFVKNTSHGISIVAEGLDWKDSDNLIVYEKEFPSNVYPWINLKRKGIEVKFIPDRGNRIDFDDIESLIDSRTRLLSISSVQFSNGFMIDLERLAELCNQKGIFLFVDAIQSLGIIPMNVKEYGIDFLAADGHKWLLAPEGTGIFYCRKELTQKLNPPLIGWKCMEDEYDYDHINFCLKQNALKFEEGSLSVMGIIALGAAVDLLLEIGIDRICERILNFGELIVEEATKRGLELLSPEKREDRSGIHAIKGDFDSKAVRDALKAEGILVNVRGRAIRIAPHFYNTEEELLKFFSSLDDVLKPA